MKDLARLLGTLDPDAELADRHIWLIKLFEWIRGDRTSVQASVSRVQAFTSLTAETFPRKSSLQSDDLPAPLLPMMPITGS